MSEMVIVAIISAVVGGFIAPIILKVADSILNKKSKNIDNASRLTSSAIKLVGQHEQDVKFLRVRMDEMDGELANLRSSNERRKEEALKFQLGLSQARQRISVLESENMELREENDNLKIQLEKVTNGLKRGLGK